VHVSVLSHASGEINDLSSPRFITEHCSGMGRAICIRCPDNQESRSSQEENSKQLYTEDCKVRRQVLFLFSFLDTINVLCISASPAVAASGLNRSRCFIVCRAKHHLFPEK